MMKDLIMTILTAGIQLIILKCNKFAGSTAV
jgi:hypothetical protein